MNDDTASIKTNDSISSSEHILEFPLLGPTMWLGSQSGRLCNTSNNKSGGVCVGLCFVLCVMEDIVYWCISNKMNSITIIIIILPTLSITINIDC